MDVLVDSTYLNVVAAVSQTMLDCKEVESFQGEIFREMGPDVLRAMLTRSGLQPGTKREIWDRLWRRLRAMPPLHPW